MPRGRAFMLTPVLILTYFNDQLVPASVPNADDNAPARPLCRARRRTGGGVWLPQARGQNAVPGCARPTSGESHQRRCNGHVLQACAMRQCALNIPKPNAEAAAEAGSSVRARSSATPWRVPRPTGSSSKRTYVRLLARARAAGAPAAVRNAAQAAWVLRWSGLISVAAQRALAATFLELPLQSELAAAGPPPALHELLADARWQEAPEPSRLPARA